MGFTGQDFGFCSVVGHDHGTAIEPLGVFQVTFMESDDTNLEIRTELIESLNFGIPLVLNARS